MDRLIEAHIAAESAGDTAGAVAMYTEDVEHDVVGAPHGPLHGKDAARGFYEQLTSDVHTEEMVPTRRYYGEDFCAMEHLWRGPVLSSASPATGSGSRSGCCTCGSFAMA